MPRDFNFEIMEEIKTRWSTRAFSGEKIEKESLLPLFEAARYAPSCFNEQPWRFILAVEEDERADILETLAPGNQLWAKKASALVIILVDTKFSRNSKNNRWAKFDTGTAWGYLSLEAERQGFIAHPMGGFSMEKVIEKYQIPESLYPLAVVAIGKRGNPDDLPEEIKNMEHPGTRKKLDQTLFSPSQFKEIFSK